MTFVFAKSGSAPSIKTCDDWHLLDYDGTHFGLFLDDYCAQFLTKDQASFLDILKMDESKISSIEITDDKIFIQPKDAENMDYERPTGNVLIKKVSLTRALFFFNELQISFLTLLFLQIGKGNIL